MGEEVIIRKGKYEWGVGGITIGGLWITLRAGGLDSGST